MPETTRGSLLILDDEVELMRALCESLAEEGFATRGFSRPAEAIDALRDGAFDLLLSDLMMPEMDGIGVLRQALEVDPHLVGIIMTGQGTIPTAVEAMKAGAFDYVLKPFRLQAMLPILDRAMGVRRLKMENVRLRAYLDRLTFESAKYRLVGTSPERRAEPMSPRKSRPPSEKSTSGSRRDGSPTSICIQSRLNLSPYP